MVSSKCCQVESPSPFRFLAALMPPCAHTECERFTGTIENRSTLPPISAILITAARPARPPPITIIFGFAAIPFDRLSSTLLFREGRPHVFHLLCARRIRGLLRETGAERVQARHAHDTHHQKQTQAHYQESPARILAGCDSPLCGKQPHAVRKMPGRAH